jgi:hypothetical protein
MKKILLTLSLCVMTAVPILQIACSSKTSPSSPGNSGPTSTPTVTTTITETPTITVTPTATTCSTQGNNSSTYYGGYTFSGNNGYFGEPFSLSSTTSLSQINAWIIDTRADASDNDIYELAVAKVVSGDITYLSGAGGAVTETSNVTGSGNGAWISASISPSVSLPSGSYVILIHLIEQGASSSGYESMTIAASGGNGYSGTTSNSLLSAYTAFSPGGTSDPDFNLYVTTCP